MENDRLRDHVAKLLQKKGCSRVQYSVFVAPHYDRRELRSLKTALHNLLQRHTRSPTDSIFLVPVREGEEAGILVLGANNVHPELKPLPLKIIL